MGGSRSGKCGWATKIPLQQSLPVSVGKLGVATIRQLGKVFLVTASLAMASITTVGSGFIGYAHAYQAKPRINLTVSGSKKAQAGKAVKLNVRLANPGLEARDSKLRIIIHDGADRELVLGAIKIGVVEKGAIKPLQVEPIDDGVMGAIGKTGRRHNQNHKRGGFPIADKANLTWKLQITFAVAGNYKIVLAVSPDNGSTHLAQPAQHDVEVL